MLQVMLHHAPSRGLTTLLFTDIAGSTEVVVQLGDRRWRSLQSRHHVEVRRQLKNHGGHEVDTAGDGFLATFSSPAAGVRCAFAIVKAVRELGLEVRAGLHIGEAELTGEKVSGIAVTTAARVSAVAGPGQVLVTSTIVQLVAGSGLGFFGVGTRELKGVPGTWELFALTTVDEQPIGERLDPDDAREARDRSSPPEMPRRSRRRALYMVVASLLAVVSVAAALISWSRQDSSATPPTSGPEPVALAAFSEGSGDEAFPINLAELRTGRNAGAILLTGRADTPEAFAWVPVGYPTYGLGLAQINRTTGAVVEPGDSFAFDTPRTTCVCAASSRGRIWTPIAWGKSSGPAGGGNGTSLRGIGLAGAPKKDILVDEALESNGVAALVSGAGYLWVGSAVADRIYRVDPRTGTVDPFELRQSADMLVFADESVFALDTLDGKITRVDPLSGRSLSPLAVSGNLQGMAVGGGYVWVTDASGNAVERISEDLLSAPISIPVGQIGGSPTAVAYDDGAIMVGFRDGTISKINTSDPSSPAVIWSRRVGNDASSVAVDSKGVVWVAGGRLSNL